ncbi:MAG: lipopolysaccharide heptosyltransferase II [Chloroflexi bacterium]|nr:lipopolysaccharide heptosyltransferase II [Chloroflexota bacterium]
MNKDALALRNRHLTEAFHTTSLTEQLRHIGLRFVAQLPISAQRGGNGRILVIRPDHLGDVLLTLPALRRLREKAPHAEIHALVGPWSAEVLAPIPEIDLVLTLPFPGFTREEESGLIDPYVLAVQTARHLRRVGYDQAYILRRDHWWGALVAFLAGIPERIGYDLTDTGMFLTDAQPYRHGHAAAASLRLVDRVAAAAPASNQRYPIDDDALQDVEALLRRGGLKPFQKYIVIHVGSGAEIKNWGAEKWAKIGGALCDDQDCMPVLTGGAHEQTAAEQIEAAMGRPTINLAGVTNLPRLAAVLGGAQLALGSDSGPMHLAAAVGTPTVTLFGAADPDEFRPWGNPEIHRIVVSDIACRPCRVLDWSGDDLAFHPCVRDISVAQVLDSARRVLNAASLPG